MSTPQSTPGNTTPGPSPNSSPDLAAQLDALERDGYRDYAARQRAEHEQNRRDDQAAHLRSTANNHRTRASDLASQAIQARRDGHTIRAEHLTRQSNEEMQAAYELEDEADAILAGANLPDRVDVQSGRDWDRVNDDVGNLAPGGVGTDDTSALTGSDRPPPVDASRPYGQRGGLRPPLAAHQRDLENAMPRDANGNVERTADPRTGDWFGLSNDGGPELDPTRSINCNDCVLSFFDTWVHGRPRVSAPRTFDAYAEGDPTRPQDGETDGPGRVEDVTGGRYQNLCPPVGHLPPAQAQAAVNHAMNNLQQQLLNGGHGSFAFIVTGWEGGSAHAWAAINQNGTILFVDPQSGQVSENAPLYGHYGQAYDGNVVVMDALVVDASANPMPLPNHPTGVWSARPPLPAPPPTPAPAPNPSPQPGPVTGTQADPVAVPAGVETPPPPGAPPPSGPPSDGLSPDATGSESAADPDSTPPDASTEPDTIVEPEVATEAAPDATADVTADIAAEPDVAIEPEAAVEQNEESDLTTESMTEPAAATDADTASDNDTDPEPDTSAEPDTAVGSEVDAEPDTTVDTSQETPAQADERRMLEQLARENPEAYAALEASITESDVVALAVSADLHGVVASLEGLEGNDRPQVVDEQYRVKALASLARKFLDANLLEPTTPEAFLATVNDRVRFSVQTPEQGYGDTVQAVLERLRAAGYQCDPDRDIKNFWRPGNRHNGVNVTLRTEDGFVIEVQFPTPASRELGKQTHELYEDVRLDTRPPEERIEALLKIFQLNREADISNRLPEGLDRLPPAIDTSFARWISREPAVWDQYQMVLAAEGTTFAEVAAGYGLDAQDFPGGGERLGLPDGDRAVELPRGIEGRQNVHTDQSDRGLGGGATSPPSGDVEPAPFGMGLGTGDSGPADVRRPVSGDDPVSGPGDGGTSGPRELGDGSSDRGGTASDLRGGRATEPVLGSDGAGVATDSPSDRPAATDTGADAVAPLVTPPMDPPEAAPPTSAPGSVPPPAGPSAWGPPPGSSPTGNLTTPGSEPSRTSPAVEGSIGPETAPADVAASQPGPVQAPNALADTAVDASAIPAYSPATEVDGEASTAEGADTATTVGPEVTNDGATTPVAGLPSPLAAESATEAEPASPVASDPRRPSAAASEGVEIAGGVATPENAPTTTPGNDQAGGASPDLAPDQAPHLADADTTVEDTSPGDDTTTAEPEAPQAASPERAAAVLASLPSTELAGVAPLPTLGGADLPVRRDQAGLITDVYVNGQWTDLPTYLDQLTDERSRLWREYSASSEHPGIRRAQAQPCISVAVDRRTGVVTEGHNNLRVPESDLHPLLRDRLDQYRRESEAREEPYEWGSVYRHPSVPGTHAEFYAVNQLLWQREAAGYPVDDSTMGELRIDNDFPWMRGGRPAPCCGNCTALIPDVPSNAGKLPYFKAPDEEKWSE